MSPATIFQVCNSLALLSWLLLIIASPFIKNLDKLLIGVIILLLCLVYASLVAASIHPNDLRHFSSLEGVMNLFKNETVVAAGWAHYLAFDLMTGIWIRKNAERHRISYGLQVPCLVFTFMLGPVGLLLYLVIRLVKTKKLFAENY
jgi:hypothetical protein